MKHALLTFTIFCQTCVAGLYVHTLQTAAGDPENVQSLAQWQGDGEVVVAQDPSIVPEDVIRIVIDKRIIPEVTKEEIDKALETMPEEQRKKVAKAWKPSPRVEEVNFSFILSNDGARKFRRLTNAHIGKSLALVVGGKVLATPVVRECILNGIVKVTGRFVNTEELLRMFPPSDPKVFVNENLLNTP